MSSTNPVVNKVDAPKADAAALGETTTTTPSSATTPRSRKRLWLAAGGAALALAGGVYGYKYFTADPGKAAAQTEPQSLAQGKEDEPGKTPEPPAKPSPFIDPDLMPPLISPPKPFKNDIDPPPIPTIEPVLPPIKPPTATKNDDVSPLIVVPPARKPEGNDTKPPTIDPDLFKAPPDQLPTTLTDRKDRPAAADTTPIIRIGHADPMPPTPPKMSDLPPIPPIDGPPIVAPPSTPPKMTDPPAPPVVDGPPVVAPPKMSDPPIPTIDPPVVGPSPRLSDPSSPVIDPPAVKSPMIPATPPPLVGIKPEKKDMYDEDWHSQRDGDTFALISKEYYKTADFAAALEAYNKDRRKPGERIIRVPPPWVLEDQFPNLVGAKNEKTTTPEPKAPDLKFEAVSPSPSAPRTAPPPVVSSASEEYRVKGEAGETIRDIARKVYGSPDSWKKLWDLNPNLDPTQPIPSGTTLRLGK